MLQSTDVVHGQFLPKMGLFLARFCPAAWIGAASLFVIVGVTEVTRAGFDSATKDVLVAVRFPAFYSFGAVMVSLGWFGAWLAGNSVAFSFRRRMYVLVLLALVLAMMAVDYVWIYDRLLQMVTPAGQPKPAVFVKYHEASKWINLAGLAICLIASVIANWPKFSAPTTTHTVDDGQSLYELH